MYYQPSLWERVCTWPGPLETVPRRFLGSFRIAVFDGIMPLSGVRRAVDSPDLAALEKRPLPPSMRNSYEKRPLPPKINEGIGSEPSVALFSFFSRPWFDSRSGRFLFLFSRPHLLPSVRCWPPKPGPWPSGGGPSQTGGFFLLFSLSSSSCCVFFY